MKRSEINRCIREMEELIRKNGFHLPPFCHWTPEEWKEKGHEYDDADFFRKAAAIAKEMGFTWGGDWTSFVDMPHLQWDAGKQYRDSDIKAGRYPPEMPLWGGEEEEVVTYKTLADVPSSYQPTIRRLMEAGALVGTSDPDPEQLEDNILNIDETYCRVMTTLDRLGLLEVADGV